MSTKLDTTLVPYAFTLNITEQSKNSFQQVLPLLQWIYALC